MKTPVFMAGTARGGTNLFVLIVNAHSNAAAVQDPYLALFKSFRNAVVTEAGFEAFDLQSPLDEYYYFESRLAVMRAIQESRLDLPLRRAEYTSLVATLEARMKLAAPLMIPYLNQLRGETYRQMFETAVGAIAPARGKPNAEVVAFNDNWAIEFFRPLARAFPQARFVAIIRDVRAALASHMRILDVTHKNPLAHYPKDKSILAMTMSFARCWRKHVAFAHHYQQLPELRDRFMAVSYERLVSAPESETRKLCRFLNLEYEPSMIDSANFIDGSGNRWIPVSNHVNVPETGIFSTTVDRWKETLAPDVLELIEFVAGPEMELAGYQPTSNFDAGLPWRAYKNHERQHEGWVGGGMGWRTDNRNPDVDFGLELLRRNALALPTDDVALQEKYFLFPAVYRALVNGGMLFSDAS